MPAVSSPYIGSKITLITNSDIRYDGTFLKLDTQQCTLSLAQVRSFGTEDRRKDKVVPARDEIYEFIVFRGSEIKDIAVCVPPSDIFRSSDLMKPHDPAIIEISSKSTATGPLTAAHGPSFVTSHGDHGVYDRENKNTSLYDKDSSYNGRQWKSPPHRNRENHGGYGGRGLGRTIGNNYEGRPGRPNDWVLNFTPDFDFTASNKVLEEVEEKLRSAHTDDVVGDEASNVDRTRIDKMVESVKFYDPEKFYDSISCEVLKGGNSDGWLGNPKSVSPIAGQSDWHTGWSTIQ